MASCARTSSSRERVVARKNHKKATFFAGGSLPVQSQRDIRPQMPTQTFCAVWHKKVRPEISRVYPEDALIFDEPIAVIQNRFENEKVPVPVYATVESMIASLLEFLETRMDKVNDLISDAVFDAIAKVLTLFKNDHRKLSLV